MAAHTLLVWLLMQYAVTFCRGTVVLRNAAVNGQNCTPICSTLDNANEVLRWSTYYTGEHVLCAYSWTCGPIMEHSCAYSAVSAPTLDHANTHSFGCPGRAPEASSTAKATRLAAAIRTTTAPQARPCSARYRQGSRAMCNVQASMETARPLRERYHTQSQALLEGMLAVATRHGTGRDTCLSILPGEYGAMRVRRIRELTRALYAQTTGNLCWPAGYYACPSVATTTCTSS